MVPPKGGNVLDVLSKFRNDMAKAQKTQAEAAKEREEKIKKVKSGGVKKPTASKTSRSRANTTTSSNSNVPTTSGAAAAAAASQADWRTAVVKPMLPLGMRQKQVVDFLRQRESPATAADISTATGRDVRTEADLAAALDANPKINVDEDQETYAYLPEANVRNREQLFEYIRRAGAPVAFSEVADAYRTVANDVAALKADGVVLGLHSYDPGVGCEVLYAVDSKMAQLECDAEVTALWQATEVPDDDDEVAVELRKIGVAPAERKAPRKKVPREKKKKQRKASKLRSVTNAHLMHLLEGEGPATLDAMQ